MPLILIFFPANSRVSFLATFSSFNPIVTTPLVFDNALLNPGGHYNSGSGIFTVPLNGNYEFTIHLWSSDQYNIHPYLVVNGNRVYPIPDVAAFRFIFYFTVFVLYFGKVMFSVYVCSENHYMVGHLGLAPKKPYPSPYQFKSVHYIY